jgi:hypothetical protein
MAGNPTGQPSGEKQLTPSRTLQTGLTMMHETVILDDAR